MQQKIFVFNAIKDLPTQFRHDGELALKISPFNRERERETQISLWNFWLDFDTTRASPLPLCRMLSFLIPFVVS